MLLPVPNDIPQSFPGYVFEIHCILSRYDVPCGTGEALPRIASELGGPTDLRISLERILRAIILREGGNLRSADLLRILISSAGADEQPGSARMEQASFQILGFLLEVRRSQKQITPVPTGFESSAPSPYTSIFTDSAPQSRIPIAEDAVLFSPGSADRKSS